MITVGFRELAIASLKLPGDWRKVLDDPNVKHLAASIRTFSNLQEAIVRRSDMQLIAGRRRVAAHVYLGLDKVYCKLVECSDDECRAIALAENAHREHDLGKQNVDLVELVALTTKVEEERRKNPDADVSRKKPKTIAHEIVAAKLGITPGALRQAEYREKLRKENQKKDLKAEKIKNLGMEFDDEFKKKVEKVTESIGLSTSALSRTSAILTELDNSGAPLHRDKLEHIRSELAILSKALRGLRPSSLCPYCKGIEQIVTSCTACLGTGYITQNQEAGVPPELWDEVDQKVVFQGKMLPIEDFLEPSVAEAEANVMEKLDRWTGAMPDPGGDAEPEEEESVWG